MILITSKRAWDIIAMNQKGIIPEELEESIIMEEVEENIDMINPEEESVERFDKPKKPKRRRGKKKKNQKK